MGTSGWWAASDRETQRQPLTRYLSSPIGELPFQHLAMQPSTLPASEIGVLHGQLPKGRAVTARHCDVYLRRLIEQQIQRLAIGGDMMSGQNQHMVGLV